MIYLLGISFILILVNVSDAVDGNCNYVQDVVYGTTYYVFNPEYPEPYRTEHFCQWKVSSIYRVNLTCTTFHVPPSQGCTLDDFSVIAGESQPTHYCGDRTFTHISYGQEMVIRFKSTRMTPGGYFLCTLQAVDEVNDYKCNCGWKKPMRIVGGTETGINEFPMVAGVYDQTYKTLICGGTIISNYHILTAAHCIVEKNIYSISVVVGEHDVTTGSETAATRTYPCKEFAIFPEYVNGNDDLAVITIVGTIQYSPLVGPACLPFVHYRDSFAGSIVTMLGWGSTEFAGEKSAVLQKVNLSVISKPECNSIFPNIGDNEICTGSKGKDACQFDSGGPVLWENPTTKRLVLVGIITSGVGCGDGPGINTRVGAYVEWIEKVTRSAHYCKAE